MFFHSILFRHFILSHPCLKSQLRKSKNPPNLRAYQHRSFPQFLKSSLLSNFHHRSTRSRLARSFRSEIPLLSISSLHFSNASSRLFYLLIFSIYELGIYLILIHLNQCTFVSFVAIIFNFSDKVKILVNGSKIKK